MNLTSEKLVEFLWRNISISLVRADIEQNIFYTITAKSAFKGADHCFGAVIG